VGERGQIRAYPLCGRLPDMELRADSTHGRDVPRREVTAEWLRGLHLRIAAATTGSGHGTARIDTTPDSAAGRGERNDRTGTLARHPVKITDHAAPVAN